MDEKQIVYIVIDLFWDTVSIRGVFTNLAAAKKMVESEECSNWVYAVEVDGTPLYTAYYRSWDNTWEEPVECE